MLLHSKTESAMQDNDLSKSFYIAALIAKQLDRELSEKEQNELSGWLLENETNRRLFEKITDNKSFERYKSEIENYPSGPALAQVKARGGFTRKSSRQIRSWAPYSIAASVVLCIGAYLVWHYNAPVHWQRISAAYGKMIQVQLPDSSRLWLNAGSTVQYPETFSGHTRAVKLVTGQAYFDVRHQTNDPFIVQINSLTITVLGTSFDVKSYADEKETKVTVSSGKVGVLPDAGHSAIMLLPDEQFIFNKQYDRYKTKQVNANDIADWREGKLSFTEDDFADVINALQRKYNVTFKIEKAALYREKITLQLDDEPLATVLQALSFSNHFKYTKHEQLIVIQ